MVVASLVKLTKSKKKMTKWNRTYYPDCLETEVEKINRERNDLALMEPSFEPMTRRKTTLGFKDIGPYLDATESTCCQMVKNSKPVTSKSN